MRLALSEFARLVLFELDLTSLELCVLLDLGVIISLLTSWVTMSSYFTFLIFVWYNHNFTETVVVNCNLSLKTTNNIEMTQSGF